jgi:hypothetical protein
LEDDLGGVFGDGEGSRPRDEEKPLRRLDDGRTIIEKAFP